MAVTVSLVDNYQVHIVAGNHSWTGDEPESAGGDDRGPAPYEMLLGGLAACKIITMQMYAQRKGWVVDRAVMTLQHHKISAADCVECTSPPNAKVDLITADLIIEGKNLTPDQIERLKEISDRCPVHRTLTSETVIRTRLVTPDQAPG